MTVDADGTLYVATALGVQFCDQAGRVNGIIGRHHRQAAEQAALERLLRWAGFQRALRDLRR